MNLAYYSSFPDYSEKNFNMEQYVQTYLTSNVIVDASASKVHYPSHRSTFTIKTMFKGDEHYRTNKCRYRVSENNFLLLNPFQEYESRIDSDNTAHSFAIFFYPSFIDEFINSNKLSAITLLDSPDAVNRRIQNIDFMEKLYLKDSKLSLVLNKIKKASEKISENQNYINEQMYSLFEYLISTQEKLEKEIKNIHPAKKSTKLELFKRLNLVKDYLESCYNENIKLSDLAKTACLSEHHLLREFKKHFKFTPHQFLINVRLQVSKNLLKQNHKSISEISSAIGFEHQSSFSQLFTQRYKISPKSYRQIIIQKSQY
ncbi:MAG: helix-turn-helix transcriptional regulator [Ignavibacteria bacterium]|nr:helix-turn-helix transcriptional regulator [Ignavibacteria bacterium]